MSSETNLRRQIDPEVRMLLSNLSIEMDTALDEPITEPYRTVPQRIGHYLFVGLQACSGYMYVIPPRPDSTK